MIPWCNHDKIWASKMGVIKKGNLLVFISTWGTWKVELWHKSGWHIYRFCDINYGNISILQVYNKNTDVWFSVLLRKWEGPNCLQQTYFWNGLISIWFLHQQSERLPTHFFQKQSPNDIHHWLRSQNSLWEWPLNPKILMMLS